MAKVQENIVVAAPQQRVWESAVDFEARPKWAPRVEEARLLDGQPLHLGSQIRLKVGWDKFTAIVVGMHSPDRLDLLLTGLGFRVNHVYELEAVNNGTSLTLSGDYHGFIGRTMSRFFSKSVRRDLMDELYAIRRAAQAPGAV